jgi:hypothetical protein
VAAPPYPPHPLVVELAKQLVKTAAGNPTRAVAAVAQAQGALDTALQAGTASQTNVDDVANAAMALADALANDPSIKELYAFAGYLGGTVNDPAGVTPAAKWQLLYLDPKLRSWLLVDQTSIRLRMDVKDETSPSGTRDHVWLTTDASVSQGEGPPQKNEIQARFLRGDFMSAGDFAASVTAGTFAPPTGPLCPLTPGCCGKKTK